MSIERDPELKRRGIASAAAAMQWGYSGSNWRYPDFDVLTGAIVGYRLKAIPRDAKHKYLWEGEKPTNPMSDFYGAPDLAEAIAAACGVVYLANGEPAVLAYHAAGIRNVFSTTHAEISVPKDILTLLRTLKVSRVLYPHDNDPAGRQSAVKFRDELAASGIDYEALDLSAHVAEKGDFNDLLIAAGAERARELLLSLPPSDLPAPIEKPAPKQTAPFTDVASLTAAIGKALDLDPAAVKASGFSRKNFKCLWHDDHHASAGYNWHTGQVHCFVCGTIPREDVAARLNIDVSQYQKPTPAQPLRHPQILRKPDVVQNDAVKVPFTGHIEQPAPPRSWWDSADVPHSHHAALLLTCDVGTARLTVAMHTAFLAGELDGQRFTPSQVMHISPIERSAMYRALDKLEIMGLVANLGIDKREETTIPKNATVYRICDPSGLKWALFQRGIYPALFKRYFAVNLPTSLPPAVLDEDDLPDDATLNQATLRALAAVFDELATDADRAQQSKFKSELQIWHKWLNDPKPLHFEVAPDADKTAYRAAILRAVLANADPNARHARRDLARLCGCSENTLDTLYKALEIVPVEQHEYVAITATTPKGMNQQRIEAQKTLSGKVMKVLIDGTPVAPDDYTSIQEAQKHGITPVMKVRVASKLRPMTADERQRAADKPTPTEPDATTDKPTEAKPVITLFERWLRIALNRMGYTYYDFLEHIARTNDSAIYEVSTNDLIDFILKARRLEHIA